MPRNPAAVELGKQRWKGVPKAERSEFARKLNDAKMTSMTPEQRSEIARKAVLARWAKKRKGPKS
jgi:hypothetical protein